jgi:hypothetical protein
MTGAEVMVAAAVVSAVAAVGAGVSSYIQGQAQASAGRKQADYARAMAARNQQVADMAAQNAEAKGQYEAGLLKERARKLLSKQIALTGASGVDMYGSPLEVMSNTWSEGIRDANTTLYNASYDAWKYRTAGETSLIEGSASADRFNTEADFSSAKGTTSLAMTPLAVGSSILTSYNKYQYYQKGSNPYAYGIQ